MQNEEVELFVGEVGECLNVIEEGVLQLEQKGARPELVSRLFNATHNIKGASSIIGFTHIEKVAHSMEDLLSAIRKQILDVSPAVVDLLLAGKDTLKGLLSSYSANAPLPESQPVIEQISSYLKKGKLHASTSKTRDELLKALLEKISSEDCEGSLLVCISLNPSSKLKEVRFVQVQRALGKVATILAQEPKEVGDGETLLAVKTSKTFEELQEIVKKVPEVNKVVVEPIPFKKALEEKNQSEDQFVESVQVLSALQTGEHTVRLPISILSRFSQDVAEIMSNFSRIRQLVVTLRVKRGSISVFELAGAEEVMEHLQLLLDELQQNSLEMRFVAIDTIFSQLRRMIRKLSMDLGKEVIAEITGGEVKLDGAIVEKIREPLIHIVRNSLDHGIESPQDRIESRKSPSGKLRITALSFPGHIQIIVEDDGKGINYEAVVAAAIEKGLLAKEKSSQLSQDEILSFLFAPGFSTREDVTEISGRGVGLDVVKKSLEDIKGNCRIETTFGKGTRFIIQVPSTMLIQKLLFFSVSDRDFAVPLSDVVEILIANKKDFINVFEQVCVKIGNVTLTVYWMRDLLDLPNPKDKETEKLLLLIVRTFTGKAAFVIDEIKQEAERVIKPLPSILSNIPSVLGVTLNDTGEALLVLNPLHLATVQKKERAGLPVPLIDGTVSAKRHVPLILVVDDSQLAREVLRDVLEGEGYLVEVAVNGGDALDLLKERHYDLIVADIEMPVMNGFELLKALYSMEEYKNVPKILVTGQIKEEEMHFGLELGASAYVGKTDLQEPSFLRLLQDFLETKSSLDF